MITCIARKCTLTYNFYIPTQTLVNILCLVQRVSNKQCSHGNHCFYYLSLMIICFWWKSLFQSACLPFQVLFFEEFILHISLKFLVKKKKVKEMKFEMLFFLFLSVFSKSNHIYKLKLHGTKKLCLYLPEMFFFPENTTVLLVPNFII